MGIEMDANPDGRYGLRDILEALPVYANLTAKLSGKPLPPAQIKAKIEALFTQEVWPQLSSRFDSYQFVNYEGTRVGTDRTGDESGGWTVVIKRGDENAFIFLRGSRTEAGIWRLITDARDSSDCQELLAIGQDLFARAQVD
jgi:hypothetical protein